MSKAAPPWVPSPTSPIAPCCVPRRRQRFLQLVALRAHWPWLTWEKWGKVLCRPEMLGATAG